jgi:hypothetical protein
MNDGKDLEGSSCSLIAVLSQHLPGWAEENYEKKSLSKIVTIQFIICYVGVLISLWLFLFAAQQK